MEEQRNLGRELSVHLFQFLTCYTVEFSFPLLRITFPIHRGKSIIPYEYSCNFCSVGCYTTESVLALFLFCPRADAPELPVMMTQAQWGHRSVQNPQAQGLVQCRDLHQGHRGLSPPALQISNLFSVLPLPHAMSRQCAYSECKHCTHRAHGTGWEGRHLTAAWQCSERREVTNQKPNIELPLSQHKHHIINSNEFKGYCTSAVFL